MDFTGKRAIVTGGASGIGREVVRLLAAQNAAIAIADINVTGAASVVDELSPSGGRAIACEVDVTAPEQVDAMVQQTCAELGGLEILVHCAGIGVEAAFLDTTLEQWNRVIGVDLTGAFLCGQAAAREMVNAGYGRIVHIASAAGMRGGARRAAYGAAKGGVVNLTQVMANELAEHGVTVNALAPGAIETELVTKMHTEETRRVYNAAIPMNRYGTPTETAMAAVFLASEEASYVTGQILGVDGGFLGAGLIIR